VTTNGAREAADRIVLPSQKEKNAVMFSTKGKQFHQTSVTVQ
jgi:hypothetical protein